MAPAVMKQMSMIMGAGGLAPRNAIESHLLDRRENPFFNVKRKMRPSTGDQNTLEHLNWRGNHDNLVGNCPLVYM